MGTKPRTHVPCPIRPAPLSPCGTTLTRRPGYFFSFPGLELPQQRTLQVLRIAHTIASRKLITERSRPGLGGGGFARPGIRFRIELRLADLLRIRAFRTDVSYRDTTLNWVIRRCCNPPGLEDEDSEASRQSLLVTMGQVPPALPVAHRHAQYGFARAFAQARIGRYCSSPRDCGIPPAA